MATLSKADLNAMARAIDQVRQRGGEHKRQIEQKLREDPWEQVGSFASYSCQDRALKLRPWMTPPCWLRTDDDVEAALATPPPDLKGERAAAKLVHRLLAAGLSRYEPSPL